MKMINLSLANAYWNQRFTLSKRRERMLQLIDAIGRPTDLAHFQWAQLMAFALEFKPDIILELGRGWGNSTCAFTEVAHWLLPHRCQVLSLCLSNDWEQRTIPKLSSVVSEDWFQPLQALRANILDFDFVQALTGFERVMVFWDAHGYDVAECILGQILPEIADRSHVVIMHDLTDARYMSKAHNQYGEYGLWKGNNWNGPMVRIGHILSPVEQTIAITDFTTRNKLTLYSADHDLHTNIGNNPVKMTELQQALGEKLFSLQAHWFWFSLNDTDRPYTFPKFNPPLVDSAMSQKQTNISLKTRLKIAVKILLNRYPAKKFLN